MDRGAADPEQEEAVRGILCRIGSGLCFSTMGAMLKLASTHGFNAPELVFYRSVFSLPVVLAGGGALHLKGNRHVRFPKGTPLANLMLGVMDRYGVNADKFGDSTSEIDLLTL